jgi:hypothetical protein
MLTGAELEAVAGSGIEWDESNFAHIYGDTCCQLSQLGNGVYSLSTTDSAGYWTQYFYPNGDSYITMNGLVMWSN